MKPDLPHSDRAMRARVLAHRKLIDWDVTPIDTYRNLARLLGHTWNGGSQFIKEFNERDIRVCEALAGPHGKVIFAILKAKYGINDE